ncbi:MAG: hypothetical protein D6780_08260 [Candidatus Dadabacteria bacterium]|nr:MAG: hypothetical protein D6780_08260 [Candidatus Dadabacteria bacterium]
MRREKRIIFSLILFSVFIVGCSVREGPDKQGQGLIAGAAKGAISGAIVGLHTASASGPGALIGGGLGAVAGSIKGLQQDILEEKLLYLSKEIERERKATEAQAVLIQQLKKQLRLHPTREIYPADLFFTADEARLSPLGRELVNELAKINKTRLPFSRFAIICFVKGEEGSSFANYLARERARILGDSFVTAGIEPRRIVAYGVVIKEPILLDYYDNPFRYYQAVEFVPLDR